MKRIHLLPVSLLVAGALAGCAQGLNANTTIQGETGNGVKLELGDLKLQATRVVAGVEEGTGALTTTIVNAGPADELQSVTVEGVDGTLSVAPVPVPAGAAVPIGTPRDIQVQFTGLPARSGEYVELSLSFAKAGTVSGDVLLVAPEGYDAEYAPTR